MVNSTKQFALDFDYAVNIVGIITHLSELADLNDGEMAQITGALRRLGFLHRQYVEYGNSDCNADFIAEKYAQGLVNALKVRNIKDRDSYFWDLDKLNKQYPNNEVIEDLAVEGWWLMDWPEEYIKKYNIGRLQGE